MDELYAVPTQKLRVLHVLRASVGELFRHVVDLTREQVARGHEVGLVVDSLTGGTHADTILAALQPTLALGIRRMPMLRRPQIADPLNALKIERHARSLEADVIHGHGFKGGVHARAFAFRRHGSAPIRCYTPHVGSFDHAAAPPVQAVTTGVERLLAPRTDVIFFESVFIANRFHARIGDVKAMVRIVHHGIGPENYVPVTPDADAADLLYVGELQPAAGLDTLIEALVILQRRLGRPVTCALASSETDRATIEALARSRGVADNFRFVGSLTARHAFALGRVLVVPSRAASLPYVVLEAAAARVSLVASDVGGIGEVFGPFRDRLVVPDDPIALAKALERTMGADPDQVAAEAHELAAFVSSRFSVDLMASSVIAAYHEALARRASAPTRRNETIAVPS